MADEDRNRKTVGALIFEGFELLDLFGPLELLGLLPDRFALVTVAERAGPVRSAQGPAALAEAGFAEGRAYDILLVPGGRGVRREVGNPALLDWLRQRAGEAEIVASVCTGSALLARAGLLDGLRATSNKAAFGWVARQGPAVDWQRKARWVEDGRFFTASGVSAGMDMCLALIARLCGPEKAEQAARVAEYDWHRDPAWDPFAELYAKA